MQQGPVQQARITPRPFQPRGKNWLALRGCQSVLNLGGGGRGGGWGGGRGWGWGWGWRWGVGVGLAFLVHSYPTPYPTISKSAFCKIIMFYLYQGAHVCMISIQYLVMLFNRKWAWHLSTVPLSTKCRYRNVCARISIIFIWTFNTYFACNIISRLVTSPVFKYLGIIGPIPARFGISWHACMLHKPDLYRMCTNDSCR